MSSSALCLPPSHPTVRNVQLHEISFQHWKRISRGKKSFSPSSRLASKWTAKSFSVLIISRSCKEGIFPFRLMHINLSIETRSLHSSNSKNFLLFGSVIILNFIMSVLWLLLLLCGEAQLWKRAELAAVSLRYWFHFGSFAALMIPK